MTFKGQRSFWGHKLFMAYLPMVEQFWTFLRLLQLLSASEQKIWPFNWRKVRKKSWPMMTSKSDPRGHPGLKLCVHVSVMGYYRFINFHQNRRGIEIPFKIEGDFLGRLHVEWPKSRRWGDCTFARASPISLSRKPLSLDIEATPKTDLSLSASLVHRQTWRLTGYERRIRPSEFIFN